MTPLEMSILIHYRCSPTDFREGDFTAPAVREAIDRFKNSGFIRLTEDGDNAEAIYVGTDKCRVYVDALEAVSEPVQRWVIPSSPSAQTKGPT